MAELLRGAPVASSLTENTRARTDALREVGVIPTLAIVRVGERPDDLSYERGACKRAEKAGVETRRVLLPETCSQDELMGVIERVNANDGVHGCLLLRPLPSQLDEHAACEALDPRKDVDSITSASLAGVFAGTDEGFPPCTAEAVMQILAYYGRDLTGARVTVVGRSLVVGKPVSIMLQAQNATVTMCHTRTRDLPAECRRAEVLVVAAGHARTVGADCVSPGQTVIDVGVNWNETAGNFVGDVDFDAVEPIVGAITPVPGGVGAVTTAVLMSHVATAAERAFRSSGGQAA